MKTLAPVLFDRRFDDLVESARSRIPTLAPAWTDYNFHDPGMTLIDLFAWASEAQLHALSRMRRDERRAYAAMLGVQSGGGVPARGSVWPDAADPQSPFTTYRQSLVIGANARVRVEKGDLPVFRPTHPILWVPAALLAVTTRTRDGRTFDHSADNGVHAFQPFGAEATPGAALRLTFETHGPTGLFPHERGDSTVLSLGVRVARAPTSEAANPTAMRVECISDGQRVALPVVEDTTAGLSRTGVLLLDVGGVRGSPTRFELELRPRARMPLAPRILEVRLGVLPVEQGDAIDNEVHIANGQVDQRVQLDVPGLRFGAGTPPLRVRVAGGADDAPWSAIDDLAEAGPDDRVYVLDTASETLTFGNGINGRIPPAGATIVLDYPVTAGDAGNAGRRKAWTVDGVVGVFGLNLDAMTGGRDALEDIDRRRDARERAASAHALVTAADIEAAALALDDLAVARARVVASDDGARLIVMQRREEGAFDPALETATWRDAIRARLRPRLPLGTRLHVQAPQFVRFSVQADLRASPRSDPDGVQRTVCEALAKRYVPRTDGHDALTLGVDITARDLAARLRRVPGVARIATLVLLDAQGVAINRLQVPPRGLAWIDLPASTLTVARGATGATA